jgi:hypothetical protein
VKTHLQLIIIIIIIIIIKYNSSHNELLLNDVCLANLSEESLTNLGLISIPQIHECTAVFNCLAAGIEVTTSKMSFVITGMTLFSDLLPGNDSFAAILCNGNYCLLIFVAAET